ncbi:hypothetical protein DM02DRAFT_665401 [Periconia macrospinosa]|uniref:Zn(2)-C6 fungal-type domain-containing protein n=1 Tax=Periconia macrospinosa TaxID=97972 RepID=A0A2V1CWU0_9PLEO|nr:hypothetical protein DM02DRAFT_665401 [Periconia macrospinosa]
MPPIQRPTIFIQYPSNAPRRTRIPVVCERCRRLKIKCDKQRPCSQCQKYEINCQYTAFKTPDIEKQEEAVHQEVHNETTSTLSHQHSAAQFTVSHDSYFISQAPMLAQSPQPPQPYSSAQTQLNEFSYFTPPQQLSFQNPLQYSPAPSQPGELEFNQPQSHEHCQREIQTLRSEIAMLKSRLNEGDPTTLRSPSPPVFSPHRHC